MKGVGIRTVAFMLAALIFILLFVYFNLGIFKTAFPGFVEHLENISTAGPPTVDVYMANESFLALACAIESVQNGRVMPCIGETFKYLTKAECAPGEVTERVTRSFNVTDNTASYFWQKLNTLGTNKAYCEQVRKGDGSLKFMEYESQEKALGYRKYGSYWLGPGNLSGRLCDCNIVYEELPEDKWLTAENWATGIKTRTSSSKVFGIDYGIFGLDRDEEARYICEERFEELTKPSIDQYDWFEPASVMIIERESSEIGGKNYTYYKTDVTGDGRWDIIIFNDTVPPVSKWENWINVSMLIRNLEEIQKNINPEVGPEYFGPEPSGELGAGSRIFPGHEDYFKMVIYYAGPNITKVRLYHPHGLLYISETSPEISKDESARDVIKILKGSSLSADALKIAVKEGRGKMMRHGGAVPVRLAGISNCTDGKNPEELRGTKEISCQFYKRMLDCTVYNFSLPQDISTPEKWLKDYGDPKFMLYWENLPPDENHWTFTLGEDIDSVKLAISLGVLVAAGAKNTLDKTRSVAKTIWSAVTAHPVRRILTAGTVAVGVLGMAIIDNIIDWVTPRPGSLVLKVPLEKPVTTALPKPGMPVMLEWEINPPNKKVNRMHFVSPCFIEKLNVERARMYCSSYVHTFSGKGTGSTECTGEEKTLPEFISETEAEGKPNCVLELYVIPEQLKDLKDARYINSTTFISRKKIREWIAGSGIQPCGTVDCYERIKPSTLKINGSTFSVSGEGVRIRTQTGNFSLIDSDRDGYVDTYRTENCVIDAVKVSYRNADKPKGEGEYNYCNYVSPSWWQRVKDIFTDYVLPVGAFALSLKVKGIGGKLLKTVAQVAALRAAARAVVFKTGGAEWPGSPG